MTFKPFKLRDCFEHIMQIIRPQFSNKHVRLLPYYDSHLPEIMESDQDRLIRIIINMLLNAQKYT